MEYRPYMPVLKFRQGEYQALLRLDGTVKDSLYPLFIVPPIEYDFEERRLKKTAAAHVEKLTQRIKDKWGKKPCLIDFDSSLHLEKNASGALITDQIFAEFIHHNLDIRPVVSLSDVPTYTDVVKRYILQTNQSISLRLDFDELADPDTYDLLNTKIEHFKLQHSSVDLIIDFKDKLDYSNKDDIYPLLEFIMESLNVKEYKSIYIIGTSLKLDIIKKPGAIQVREDWIFYNELVTNRKDKSIHIGFGDYTVETPYFTSIDMRMLKPAAKLIYSSGNNWVVIKRNAFRDNTKQMHSICADLVQQTNVYLGPNFSNGDKKIDDCSAKRCGTGNLGTWKEAAVSHHLTLVHSQLSNFYETVE